MRFLPAVLALLVALPLAAEETLLASRCITGGSTWYATQELPGNPARGGDAEWAVVTLGSNGELLAGTGSEIIPVGAEVMLLGGDATHLSVMTSGAKTNPRLCLRLVVSADWTCDQVSAAWAKVFRLAEATPSASVAPKQPLTPGAAAILARIEREAAEEEARPGIIRRKCAKDWPDDFAMRKHCEDRQNEAAEALDARYMSHRGTEATIRAKCKRDWPTDFVMRAHCEQKQLEAATAVGE